MTEKIKETETLERYAIDPVAFATALILAPLVVALLGFWALLIPVFALFFGGPAYLILGTPILLIYLHYHQGSPSGAALLAFGTVVFGLCSLLAAGALTGNSREVESIANLGAFGLIMAPLWGAAFGRLYNRLRSDASRQPLPPFVHFQKGDIPC